MKKLVLVMLLLGVLLTSTACGEWFSLSDLLDVDFSDPEDIESYFTHLQENLTESMTYYVRTDGEDLEVWDHVLFSDEEPEVIGSLPNGSEVLVGGFFGDWAAIEYEGYTRFVKSKYLDETNVAAEIEHWESMIGKSVTNVNESDCYANRFSKGQCTWYAYGRFWEEQGIEIQMNAYGNAKTWLDNCTDSRVEVVRDLEKIVPGSIAVDYKTTDSGHAGHVVYVEYVTYDKNGTPLEVYFTESNWDSNGVYDEGEDGVVTKLTYDKFVKRGSHQVLGYLVANPDN